MPDALEALSHILKLCYPIYLYFGNYVHHTEFNHCHKTTDILSHVQNTANLIIYQLPSPVAAIC